LLLPKNMAGKVCEATGGMGRFAPRVLAFC